MNAFAEELDELADDACRSQLFGNGQNQVSCCCAWSKLAFELKADDFWQEHVDWLAKHGRFGFDTTNAPT